MAINSFRVESTDTGLIYSADNGAMIYEFNGTFTSVDVYGITVGYYDNFRDAIESL